MIALKFVAIAPRIVAISDAFITYSFAMMFTG